MPRYWVIAPFSSKDAAFAKVWAFDLENDLISIGFTKLMDVSHLSAKQLQELIQRRLRDESNLISAHSGISITLSNRVMSLSLAKAVKGCWRLGG